MVTGSLARRGFLRNVALAVGAVLVGVGRSAAQPITRTTPDCGFCNGVECEKVYDDRRNRICPKGRHVQLSWQSRGGGRCVECYNSEAAKVEAEERGGCHHCINVDCGFDTSADPKGDKEREAWGTDPEDPLDLGCRDPDTGIYYLWPEPGTPCSIYDPTPTPHDPP